MKKIKEWLSKIAAYIDAMVIGEKHPFLSFILGFLIYSFVFVFIIAAFTHKPAIGLFQNIASFLLGVVLFLGASFIDMTKELFSNFEFKWLLIGFLLGVLVTKIRIRK